MIGLAELLRGLAEAEVGLGVEADRLVIDSANHLEQAALRTAPVSGPNFQAGVNVHDAGSGFGTQAGVTLTGAAMYVATGAQAHAEVASGRAMDGPGLEHPVASVMHPAVQPSDFFERAIADVENGLDDALGRIGDAIVAFI